MAKLTWLGEDDVVNGQTVAGKAFTTAFGGIKFPRGEPVEVTDKAIIAKARGNQFFLVSPAIAVRLVSSNKAADDQD